MFTKEETNLIITCLGYVLSTYTKLTDDEIVTINNIIDKLTIYKGE